MKVPSYVTLALLALATLSLLIRPTPPGLGAVACLAGLYGVLAWLDRPSALEGRLRDLEGKLAKLINRGSV